MTAIGICSIFNCCSRSAGRLTKPSYLKSRNIVAPGTLTFIAGGPRTTFTSPVYLGDRYSGHNLYY